MRHNVKTKKLNRDRDHRTALRRNLISSLFLHDSIETSTTKAKWIKPYAEKMISIAKQGGTVNINRLRSLLVDDLAVRRLVEKVAPLMSSRNGGYTRIMKTGKIKKGDASETSVIELVKEVSDK